MEYLEQKIRNKSIAKGRIANKTNKYRIRYSDWNMQIEI